MGTARFPWGTSVRSRETGVTIISLMVGIFISMLAVLGTLSIYKAATRSIFGTGGMVATATQEGQLASSLLTAQLLLQEAGFGIPAAATGTHFILQSGTALDASTNMLGGGTPSTIGAAPVNGNVLLWESNSGLSAASADYQCAGLLYDTASQSLLVLRVGNGCHPISSRWNAVAWTVTKIAGPLAQPVDFSAKNAAGCWPFGAVPQTISHITPPTAAVLASITYHSGIANGPENAYSACLTNLAS
jgi:hypothetical protein